MAATIKNYKFTYENGAEIKLEQSINGAEYTTILEMTENGCSCFVSHFPCRWRLVCHSISSARRIV